MYSVETLIFLDRQELGTYFGDFWTPSFFYRDWDIQNIAESYRVVFSWRCMRHLISDAVYPDDWFYGVGRACAGDVPVPGRGRYDGAAL